MPKGSFRRAERTPLRSGPYGAAPFVAAILETGNRFSRATLFHYTSFENFQSICLSRTILMGRCLDTNDNEEISFAVELLSSHARDHYPQHPAQNLLQCSLDEFTAAIPPDIYFVSFTENPDLLSQWRGYAPGKGVSFGFSLKHLRSLAIEYGLRYGPVKYMHDDHAQIIDPIVKKMLDSFLIKDAIEASRCQSKLFTEFLYVAPFIKHGAFHEECEWRLVFIPDGTTRLNSKILNNSSRSIIELPIEPTLFNPSFIFGSIFVSPELFRSEKFSTVEAVLKKHNFSTNFIVASSIPHQTRKF